MITKMAEYAANMLRKPAKRAKKGWFGPKQLFLSIKNHIYWAATNAEKSENFREIFFGVRPQMVHFSSEFALEINFNIKKLLLCVCNPIF